MKLLLLPQLYEAVTAASVMRGCYCCLSYERLLLLPQLCEAVTAASVIRGCYYCLSYTRLLLLPQLYEAVTVVSVMRGCSYRLRLSYARLQLPPPPQLCEALLPCRYSVHLSAVSLMTGSSSSDARSSSCVMCVVW